MAGNRHAKNSGSTCFSADPYGTGLNGSLNHPQVGYYYQMCTFVFA